MVVLQSNWLKSRPKPIVEVIGLLLSKSWLWLIKRMGQLGVGGIKTLNLRQVKQRLDKC